MMTDNGVLPRVVALLVQVLRLPDGGTVTAETRIIEDLGAESIDIAELSVAIEAAFHVRMDGPGLRKVRTVGDLAAYVATLQASSAVTRSYRFAPDDGHSPT